MRKVFCSLLIGCTWTLASMYLMYLEARPGPVFWQTNYLFWPGGLIATEIAVIQSTGQLLGEGWRDILVVVTANFWIAASSNIIFFSAFAYGLFGPLSKATRKSGK